MCRSTYPLEIYAEQICSASKQITNWCIENKHPHPSFDAQAPSIILPSSAPQSILTARQTLVEAACKLQQLATEPNEYLSHLAIHYQVLSCIHWLCHFRVLSFIPLQGSVPRSEVATAAMVPESQLKAVSHMAMTSNFLCEPKPGELAHIPASALFVTNPGLLDWALFMAKGSAPTASKLVEATEKWGTTESKTQTAFNISNNTDLSFFEYISQTPDMAKLFVSYMKNITSSEGTKISHLVKGYDWVSLGKAIVVDMGGSDCHASVALATAYPNLSFIVQDLPDTIANGPALLAVRSDDIRSRISCQAHNFFSAQPVTNADVYFLRMIFHDWPDKEALTILRHLLPVLKGRPSARLIIMDTVLPDPGSVGRNEEALLRVRDLTMLQAFNSKERELGDWKNLFASVSAESAGGALKLQSVSKPFGSLMSLLEVVYIADEPMNGVTSNHSNGNGWHNGMNGVTNGLDFNNGFKWN